MCTGTASDAVFNTAPTQILFSCVLNTSSSSLQDQMSRRCDPAPSSFSFLSFHLCLGNAADASRRSSHTGYFIKLRPLNGEGDRDLRAPTSVYPFHNKRPEPLPEEPPKCFANAVCTQNDSLLLPPWKGLRGASPLLAPPELR